MDIDPLDQLVEDYLDRRRRGDHPTPAEYAARYPALGTRILELFPALELMERLKPTAEDHAGMSGDARVVMASGDPRDRPESLGDYSLLRELGRGGMGIVYEAERASLKNRVALKVMHTRFRADRAYVRRFQTEARSAAKLHHTNIVPVFDYGEEDGVCYYAMQYIDGVGLELVLQDVRKLRGASRGDATPAAGTRADDMASEGARPALSVISHGLLTGRFVDGFTVARDPGLVATAVLECDGAPPLELAAAPSAGGVGLTSSSIAGQPESVYFREVARLGAQVADALEHAHRQGVVHRDIKPSNLLLDAEGNVWVTDFGLAKLLEGDDLSQSHDLVGTMRFMAPERFRGITDRRGDIYALGATLYELLTLRPAFAAPDQARLLEQIAHEPPSPLWEHDRRIPRDLATLVLKAMAKAPEDRFATAGELAEELRRFLESRPIRSRPVPVHERFWRWCRRNPWLAGANIAAATLMTLLAIGATIAAWTYYDQKDQIHNALIQARGSETEAIQARIAARGQLFEALLDRARAGRFSGRFGQRFESLDALAQATAIGRELKLPPQRFEQLRDEAIAALALPDLKVTGRVIQQPPGVMLTAFDPTLTRYALRFRDGAVQVRRAADDTEIAHFNARGDRDIFIFAFSPDGRYLATSHFPGYALTVWEINRGTIVATDPGGVMHASFSPDSRRIACGRRDGGYVIHDLTTGHADRREPGSAPVDYLAFHPCGSRIAVIASDLKAPACRILEAETGRLVRSIPLPAIGSVAWSPDGNLLATGHDDAKIYLWDAATGARKAALEGSNNGGLLAAFHPSGTLMASNGWESRLRIWDTLWGRPVLSLTDGIQQPAFSQDGRIVVSMENRLTTYQVDPALEYQTLACVASDQMRDQRSAIRHDGRVLAVATNQGLALWDLARRMELAFLRIGSVEQPIFEESGDLITSGAIGVRRWPIRLDEDRGEFRIGPPVQLPLPPGIGTIAEDREGRIVAVAYGDHALVATPERTIRVGPLDDCRSVAVSPDGEWLATGSHGHTGAQIWRIRDASHVANLPVEGLVSVVFSPDGKWLMTTPSPCRIWAVGTWREADYLIGGEGRCFSPDGRLVVMVDASRAIRLVETESGRTLARLESPDSCSVTWATFSPDGARLVVNSPDGPAVHVWNLRAIHRHLALMGLDWKAPADSDDDPAASSSPSLPPLQVNLGSLVGHLEHYTEPVSVLIAQYTARITGKPNDADAYHHRGHAFSQTRRFAAAVEDFTSALRLRPNDAHLLLSRAQIYMVLRQYTPAIADLEAALARNPNQPEVRATLAGCSNNQAWLLSSGPVPTRDPERALRCARRAVELTPDQGIYLNTLGVAEYRAGHYAEGIATLERSKAANREGVLGFDLVFLAMAHHRLGHGTEAHMYYDQVVRWMEKQNGLTAENAQDLATFRAEAEAVLAGLTEELPIEVFAP